MLRQGGFLVGPQLKGAEDVLAAAALVMLMTPGLGFFYAGLVRRKNVLSTLMHSFFILCLISLQWVLLGYTLAFGPDVRAVDDVSTVGDETYHLTDPRAPARFSPPSVTAVGTVRRHVATFRRGDSTLVVAAFDAEGDTAIAAAQLPSSPPLLLVVDALQDPQNFGNLLRTALAVGVLGVVLPNRRSVQVTAAVGRASAGAIELLKIARVGNLVRAQ